MNNTVLVCCEESQRVCTEFRLLGDNAFSCDIQPCSGGHPEWHIPFDLERGGLPYNFYTSNGEYHHIAKWDLVIAHPPCTYLARSGERYMNERKYGDYARERAAQRQSAIDFFNSFTRLENVDCVAIENPIGVMSREYREPDQIIQPWMWGDNEKKSTCLWLKNLPNLVPEVTEQPELDEIVYIGKDGLLKRRSRLFYETAFLPKEERRKARSKTFPGIAKAMAEQWSAHLDRYSLRSLEALRDRLHQMQQ